MPVSHAPVRPAIPTAAWFAVGTCAGSVCAEAVAWPFHTGMAAAVSASVFGLFAVALALWWRARSAVTSCAMVLSAGLLAGCVLSTLQCWSFAQRSATLAHTGAREWTGVVEADPAEGIYGTVLRIRIRGGPLGGARIRVGWPNTEDVPDLGRTVRFSAILKPLPVAETWARRVARSGVCATGTAWRARTGSWRAPPLGPLFRWRATMLGRMHSIPGAGGDLAEGIVLGDRRRLVGTETEEDFRILGLTHLVAVSGSHLAAACAAVAFLGTRLRMRKRPLVLATVAAGAVYAIVTGLPYSALRSLMMLAVGGVGQIVGRRGDGIASLAVAVVMVLMIEPWAVFDLGLQLSAFAVCGLLLFGNLADAWATAGLSGWRRTVGQALSLTLVAQFTTVPVVASAFGMISLLAPVANAVAGPLVSVAMLLGLAGAVSAGAAPVLGDFGCRAAATVLDATAWIARGLAQVPGAAVAMNGGLVLAAATVLLAGSLWVWWPVPRHPRAGARFMAATLCCSVALALGPAPAQQCTITVLDVGQGDAILLRDCGRTMLVDTGPDALALRRALARSGVRRIDVLVLTHAHGDHTAGAPGLNGVAEVGWIGVPGVTRGEDVSPDADSRDPMPGGAAWSGPSCPVRMLAAGESWRVGGSTVRVLWPPAEAPDDLGANDTSVVLAISRGRFDMALTGDAEGAVQAGLIASGSLGQVEVLKVPHHGSTNGLTSEGLDAWSPQDAIISVGAGNDFGHPCAETLALLADRGVRVLRTDLDGDISVEVRRSGYRVRVTRRGSRTTVRARMRGARSAWTLDATRTRITSGRGSRGCHDEDDRRVEERLPDLRRRGTVARARPPPAEGSHRRGCGPRLQLRSLRW